ncbi:MAG: hypothetical protein ACREI2_04860 [Nitrospiraceae bacterium]
MMLSRHGLDRFHPVLMCTLYFMILQVTHLHVPCLVTPRAGQDQQDSPSEKNHQRFGAQAFQHCIYRLFLRGFPELDDLL